MNESVIEMSDVHKSFKQIRALSGFNLQVPPGSIYGFLGPNGAGKTTAIKLLIGTLAADSGEARIFGLPVSDRVKGIEIRKRIGFVSEDKEMYPYMTVEQMLRFIRPFYPNWRRDLERRYLDLFELPLNSKLPALSKGMRAKLMLMLAISRGADLLILDEPLESMDPAIKDDVLRELVDLTASEGTTIFFSSHQISEIEQIADHVCIIDHGVSKMAGAIDDMKMRYQRIQITFPDGLPSSVHWVEGVEQVRQEGRVISILARDNLEGILAQGRSFPGALTESFPMTLKEIFMRQVRSR